MAKMVIVRQHDLQDCGACCLASIIEYYDGYVPMERIRLDTKTTKDGTTAFNLFQAAQKYGFATKGIKTATLDDANIFLPAIAHVKYKNGFNHFVVLYEITKTSVILMDPAKGKVKMKRSEFATIFSEILLMFYPQEKIVYLAKGKSIWLIWGDILKQEKMLFVKIVLISILLTLTTIAASYYFKIGLDGLGEVGYGAYLKLIILVFAIVTLFKITFTYLRSYLENHLNKNIDVLLLADFLNHLFKIPSTSMSSRSSAEIMTRVKELNNIKALYTELFINFLLDFILMFSTIPLLIWINSKLFLILFLVVTIYLIIGLLTMRPIYRKAYQNITYEEEFNNYLLEAIEAYPAIKNLNLTSSILKNIEEKLAILLYDNFKLNEFVLKEENLKNGISEIGYFSILSCGFYFILQQDLTLANLLTFSSLMTYFLNPVKNLIDTLPKFNFFKATFTKISDFLSITPEKMGKRISFKEGNLTVKNLSFSYNDYHLVLQDVNFAIAAGAKVMFKGPSGCGKSTMCKLFAKMYSDFTGTIEIDGKNILDCSLKTIRENITYVSQNETIFTDTIWNNLVLGRNIPLAKVNEIAHVCLLDEVINKKRLRYETIVNNYHKTISGGEKQRIILARALLKEAKIIILDEPLSEVDYAIERQIITNLKTYFPQKTLIYVTHKNQDDLFDKVITFEALDAK